VWSKLTGDVGFNFPMNNNNFKYAIVPTAEFDEASLNLIEKRLSEQNSNLDILEKSVFRLGEISLSISNEIKDQNQSLSKLETEVEGSNDNVKTISARTKEIVNTASDTSMFCIIICLLMLLIFLVILVVFT